MMGFGLLIPILLIAVLAYTLGWRPQLTTQGGGGHADQDDPSEILRRRYARGDISRDEFERMRDDIRS